MTPVMFLERGRLYLQKGHCAFVSLLVNVTEVDISHPVTFDTFLQAWNYIGPVSLDPPPSCMLGYLYELYVKWLSVMPICFKFLSSMKVSICMFHVNFGSFVIAALLHYSLDGADAQPNYIYFGL